MSGWTHIVGPHMGMGTRAEGGGPNVGWGQGVPGDFIVNRQDRHD